MVSQTDKLANIAAIDNSKTISYKDVNSNTKTILLLLLVLLLLLLLLLIIITMTIITIIIMIIIHSIIMIVIIVKNRFGFETRSQPPTFLALILPAVLVLV